MLYTPLQDPKLPLKPARERGEGWTGCEIELVVYTGLTRHKNIYIIIDYYYYK